VQRCFPIAIQFSKDIGKERHANHAFFVWVNDGARTRLLRLHKPVPYPFGFAHQKKRGRALPPGLSETIRMVVLSG
jgi:hypothetical protein